ncbi:MerR family transcriptional regulator [Pelagibacterium xiamenense]|uniref:MerR family transcriptional regulator n=1 Tax=Pelagibacterium xiamenense TaxID=2901140 RepID=UPI001E4205C9|nr:MerR family transcriptional regulator [Pelagibacterium xiamenense]MCD7059938.1 MerR family transcriptional regulator [Pelagibacterium xiamenense]
MHTVKQVAQMAGVSVRTLHHYDAIGLLSPAHVGTNGYRYYGRDELLRLQQILIHRELGIPLAEIGAILDDPGFDRLDALVHQRARIAQQADRYAEMLRTIDRTIAELKGDRGMKDEDLYSGIVDPRKQAEYEDWLAKRYGPGVARQIEESKARAGALPEAEMAAAMDELKAVEQGLAQAMKDGTAPEGGANDALLERHRAWVSRMWDRPCPAEAYAGLADMYLAHPDFVARYEAIAEGFAEYLAKAMKAYAGRLDG